MIGVGIAYGNDYFTGLDVELAFPELLVDPELLDVHLAAFFHLGFIFSGFLGLYLHGGAIATMLKLYLGTQCPSLAEVVAEVQTYVWQVDASMALVVGLVLGFLIAVETLTVKIAGHGSLSIPSNV